MMAEGHLRRYAIKPDEGYFYAGVTPDNEQVLIGLFCPNLVAFYFDPEGTLLRTSNSRRDRPRRRDFHPGSLMATK